MTDKKLYFNALVQCKITKKQRDRLQELARKEGLTMACYVRRMIIERLAEVYSD